MRPTTSVLLTTSCIILLSLLFVTVQPAQAAPGTFIPVTVTQPDGTELDLFASGDEYYNWLHDANGYTVMQDPDTGYYVYADLIDGELVPTALLPGLDDPAATGLVPQLNISPERRQAIRREFLALAPRESITSAPKTGTINNLVTFIRFSGEAEPFGNTSTYTGMLNTSAGSLRSYFLEASYNALTIDSQLFPVPGSTIISYQDSHTRGYFQPWSVTNTIGYTGGDNGSERTNREHTLLRDAITHVNGLAQFPSGATIDADGDGYVDDVTFVISGNPTGWASLLWPHAWSLYSQSVYINGKRVYGYEFQMQSMTNASVLAHETFHVLGAPDLYRYYDGTIAPVGAWDLMSSNQSPPQHMSCFMKWKYGHWINSIPELTMAGDYSLNPMGSSGDCYKIASPNSTSEYYVVEYRSRTASSFETALPGSGLLVWRINTTAGSGNAYGPPDEVYVYRPGGINPTTSGTVNQAYYSAEAGRTTINDSTSPSPFLSDGSPGGLDVHTIGSAGATISFHLGGSMATGYLISGNAGASGATLSYYDSGPKTAAADSSGNYSFMVPEHWTGAVTPSKADYVFTPDHRDYADVTTDQLDQDYAAEKQTPTVVSVFPEPLSTSCLRPQVGVRLLLAGLVRLPSGAFNPATVTLKLDNVDRTSAAQITQTASMPATHAVISYTPTINLSAGPHHGEFTYPSPGGPVPYSWDFTAAGITCPTSAEPTAPDTATVDAPAMAEPAGGEAQPTTSGSRELTSAAAPDDALIQENRQAELAVPTISSAGMPAVDPAQRTRSQTAPQPVPPRVQAPTTSVRGVPHPGLYQLLLDGRI